MLEKTLQYNLKKIIEKFPENIAIEYKGQSMSFKELDEKSDYIAKFLIDKKLNDGKFIGLLINDKKKLITFILGILKAKSVFVPLDTNYPLKRTELMIDEAKIPYVFMEKDSKNLIKEISLSLKKDIDTEIIDEDFYNKYNLSKVIINDENYSPKDKIYVYFTSGTTGKPKAIVGKNISLLHFIKWEISEYKIDETFKVSQFTSQCHDPFLRDIFVPLFSGGTICIPKDKEEILDEDKVVKFIEENKINLIHCTPSLFKIINNENLKKDNFENLKYIFLAGEKVSKNIVSSFYKIFNNNIQLVNLYGPTETTLAKLHYNIKLSDINNENIPIGMPIKGSKVIILDKELNICEQGKIGEIYIRTPFRTYGYFNDTELNNKNFRINPFNDDENDLIYKTGDLGRIIHDGNIEFHGRVDNQIKIRGFRIELSAIEKNIMDYLEIKEAVVISEEDKNNEKYLIGFYVSEKIINDEEIRGFLKKEVPDYMVPMYMMQVEKIPMTQNGKIDRNFLLDSFKNKERVKKIILPTNDLEERLLRIWNDILDVKNIGIEDNFFDVGGNSLRAAFLIAKIKKEFSVEVHLAKIFNKTNIKEQSDFIKTLDKKRYIEIKKADKKEYYELSSAQKRMFLLNQFESDSINYNIAFGFILEGNIDNNKIERAFKNLLNQHDSLRTQFKIIDGEPYQVILEEIDFKINYKEIEEKNIDEELRKLRKPFNLLKAPLINGSLLKFDKNKYLFFIEMHHIISDGYSLNILIRDFISLYNGEILEKNKMSYIDYSYWGNSKEVLNNLKNQEEYWLNRFSEEVPVLDLQLDFSRPKLQNFEGETIEFEISKEMADKIYKLNRDKNITMNMFFIAALNILLYKYTSNEDIVIGTPISGRANSEFKDIVGMFVNTLAQRNYPEENKTIIEFINEVKKNAIEDYQNQNYQFERLIDNLKIKRDLSRNPLFDVMLNVMNYSEELNADLEDISIKIYKREEKIAKFDLTLNVLDRENILKLSINYCTKLFKKETILRMKDHFINILDEIIKYSDKKIKDIKMISNEEKMILDEINNTKTDFPKDKTLQELFEEQVKNNPENIALLFNEKKLTYKELNEKSNKLANYLIKKGVKANTIVALMLDRSLEMIIAIIGVLKAGGAYMPIDPSYPLDRVNYMLEDSKTKLILSDSELMKNINFDYDSICFDEENFSEESNKNPINIGDSDNLAYIIYTSGSTGNPKGNLTSHYNVSRVVKETNYINIGSEDTLLQLSNYAFDGSVFDIFGSLLNGAKLILIEKKKLLELEELKDLIIKEKVTIFFVTTALFNVMVDNYIEALESVNKILFGGEQASVSHARKAVKKLGKNKIINVYGPTETTVFATYYNINYVDDIATNIPIGRPISNTAIYILDKNENIQAYGIAGEICIAGEGLAKGYLNKQDLTEEKFIFNKLDINEKIYKTGDLAKWNSKGYIEFLGRIDRQIKLRGFRIELGEIESQIAKYDNINQVIVMARQDDNLEKYLCAYIISKNKLDINDLKGYLGDFLPSYMIPDFLIEIDEMPLTKNGKVDSKKLPIPNLEYNLELEEANNILQEKLIEIWKEVLGIKEIGITNNFFDLGGHSLKATILVSKIRKELSINISLIDIFKYPTIKLISENIENYEKKIVNEIIKVDKKEYYDISENQKKLWILNKFNPSSKSYLIKANFKVEKDFDKEIFEKTVRLIVKKHESLRTIFKEIENVPKQKILDNIDLPILYEDEEINEEKLLSLETEPLFYIKINKIESDSFEVRLILHHIIADGFSLEILMKEFLNIYNNLIDNIEYNIVDLDIQYKDFSEWQTNLFADDEAQLEVEKFWESRFKEEIPEMNLDMDYPENINSSIGVNYISYLNKDLKEKLMKIAKENNTTLFNVLYLGYNIFLAALNEQKEVFTGIISNGRMDERLYNVVGHFVNLIPFKMDVDFEEDFSTLLRSFSENIIKSLNYQNFPLEKVYEKLKINEPKIDITFNMIESKNEIEDEIKNFDSYFRKEEKETKFLIETYIAEYKNGIRLVWNYKKDCFEEETIVELVDSYFELLDELIEGGE